MALIAMSSACSDSAPSVISHNARVDADNGQIVFVSVVLSAPARAAVEYENEFAGKFRTAMSETAVEHVIPVVRLRANTTYQYAVAVEDRDGVLAYGARGEFVTGNLPGGLAMMRERTSGESSQDLILADYRTSRFAPNSAGDVGEHFIVMRDALGYAVWRYASHVGVDERILGGVRVQPNGGVMYQITNCCIIEITPLGERVNEIAIPAQQRPTKPLPDAPRLSAAGERADNLHRRLQARLRRFGERRRRRDDGEGRYCQRA